MDINLGGAGGAGGAGAGAGAENSDMQQIIFSDRAGRFPLKREIGSRWTAIINKCKEGSIALLFTI
eukprot:762090-Hanusia_phi.AAC.3